MTDSKSVEKFIIVDCDIHKIRSQNLIDPDLAFCPYCRITEIENSEANCWECAGEMQDKINAQDKQIAIHQAENKLSVIALTRASDKIGEMDKQIADQGKLIAEQYEDNVDAVADLDKANKQIAELKEYKTAALFSWESLPEYKKAQAKITELQAVVDRLASNRSMSGDYGSSSIEFNARIEYAAKHAIPEGPDDDLLEWPCQQLMGGAGEAIYSNVDGMCTHIDCHPKHATPEDK